jgi:hypothetical protein
MKIANKYTIIELVPLLNKSKKRQLSYKPKHESH